MNAIADKQKPPKRGFGRGGRFWRYLAAGSAVIFLCAAAAVWLEAPLMRAVSGVFPPLDTAPFLTVDLSPALVDRRENLMCAYLNEDQQWLFPVDLDAVSPWLVQATLAAEDKRFFSHAGIDLRAVLRAAWRNLRAGRIVSGASTLTMQLANRHQTARGRLAGKVEQAFTALRLDRAADKRSILAAYLNTAPYGGNLVGVEAAARRYFGKCCTELTLEEAALLAGLPKSPTAMNPLFYPERAQARRDAVLRRMRHERMISEKELREALERPPGVRRHEYPVLAPHLAQSLGGRARDNGRLALTLDGTLQARLEEMIPLYLRQFNNQVNNAAVMVVDVREGTVLARVGSADFASDGIRGQYDVCRARRAPGSALKPFIYAYAMEQQRLYPSEAFLDQNLDFGVYNPNNFDGEFKGLISAGEALRWSLNIPAVQVLERAGLEEAVTFLRSLGFSGIQYPSGHYGLGLVLGNCEVTLEALVNAYLVLARLGVRQDAVFVRGESAPASRRLLSEGTALALWYMLEQPFPDEPWSNVVRLNDRSSRICWKTGTSTGFRDAWAVAFNSHYVIGAWLGNTNGSAAPRLIGAHAALPLVARIFRSLPVPPVPAWPSTEGRLCEVQICALSGLPKSPWCSRTATALFPAGQFLHRRCDVHRPGLDGTVGVYWPPTTRRWDLAKVPASEGAAVVVEEAGPSTGRQRKLSIKRPVQNATYVLSGETGEDRIRLEANIGNEELQWYCNGRYLGASDRMRPLFLDLLPGQHQVSCMSASGQTAKVDFNVSAS